MTNHHKDIAIKAAAVEATRHQSEAKVAARFGVAPCTIHRWVHQLNESGSLIDKKPSGRPASIDERDGRSIRRILLSNRFLSLDKVLPLLTLSCVGMSLTHLHRFMRSSGLKRYRAQVKPFLNASTRTKRVLYARRHLPETEDDWRRTISLMRHL